MNFHTFLRRLEKRQHRGKQNVPRKFKFEEEVPLVEFVFFVELDPDESYLLDTSEVQLTLFLPNQGASLDLIFLYPYESDVEQTLFFTKAFSGDRSQLILSADVLSFELCLEVDAATLVKRFELDEIAPYAFLASPSLTVDYDGEEIIFIEEN